MVVVALGRREEAVVGLRVNAGSKILFFSYPAYILLTMHGSGSGACIGPPYVAFCCGLFQLEPDDIFSR